VFRGSEIIKLVSMLVFLGVLGMLMFRFRDPSMWQWVSHDGESEDDAWNEPPAKAPKKSAAKAATSKLLALAEAETSAKPDSAATPGNSSPPADDKKSPAIADVVGLVGTDEDPDQQIDAEKEFAAIYDGTVGIQPEEMFAYWRLILWSKSQSFAAMHARAQRKSVYTDLMVNPEKSRGKLVEFTLQVRRVLEYETEKNRPFEEVKKLYEIWGFTEESKSWPYCLVTHELPKGMRIGPNVVERVRFVGYFFKLQGYYEAGSKPHAKSLRCPLLVGRVQRYPTAYPVSTQVTSNDNRWAWIGLGVVVVVLVFAVVVPVLMHRRLRQRQTLHDQRAGEIVHEWIQEGGPESLGEGGEGGEGIDSGHNSEHVEGNGRPRSLDHQGDET
jgi:hypothetical protein